MSAELRQRHVVTAFLVDPAGRVLLLRRSDRVSTYQGRWAGVSGSVHEEESPLAQARREISEETGLAGDAAVLVADGPPEELDAPELGIRWIIHPFLFHTAAPERARIDWEHEELRWVAPDEVAGFATVPRLVEVLGRVDPRRYPPDQRARARAALRDDRLRGATALTEDARRHLVRVAALGGQPDAAGLLADLRAEVRAVAALRPALVAVEAAGLELLDAVSAGPAAGAPVAALRCAVWDWWARRRGAQAAAPGAIAGALRPWLSPGGRVATLSHSGLVREALLALGDRLGGVVVLESRPRQEGRALAAALAARGVPVTVLADGAVAAAVAETDVCLVGADAVGACGRVVNKTGSHALALAARAAGRAFLVATTTDRLDPLLPRAAERQPPEELWEDAPAAVTVVNEPFEVVPADLVSALLTEAGPLDEAARRAGVERARARRERWLGSGS